MKSCGSNARTHFEFCQGLVSWPNVLLSLEPQSVNCINWLWENNPSGFCFLASLAISLWIKWWGERMVHLTPSSEGWWMTLLYCTVYIPSKLDLPGTPSCSQLHMLWLSWDLFESPRGVRRGFFPAALHRQGRVSFDILCLGFTKVRFCLPPP